MYILYRYIIVYYTLICIRTQGVRMRSIECDKYLVNHIYCGDVSVMPAYEHNAIICVGPTILPQ